MSRIEQTASRMIATAKLLEVGGKRADDLCLEVEVVDTDVSDA